MDGEETGNNADEFKLGSVYEEKKIISSGSGEVDKRLGGGIPVGALTLIEGANDTGKSVVTEQLMWGGLEQGFTFAIYTSENTIRSLLQQMVSLNLNITDHYLFGHLKIYPFFQVDAMIDGVPLLDYMAEVAKTIPEEIVIIDSLTVLVAGSNENKVIDFFSKCKKICDKGKTLFITVHTYAFSEDTLTRIRSLCDAHIILRTEEVGDRLVKTMEVAKIRGAQKNTGNIVAFDVEAGVGLRIIPLSKTKA